MYVDELYRVHASSTPVQVLFRSILNSLRAWYSFSVGVDRFVISEAHDPARNRRPRRDVIQHYTGHATIFALHRVPSPSATGDPHAVDADDLHAAAAEVRASINSVVGLRDVNA
jgi:hypothetical protein